MKTLNNYLRHLLCALWLFPTLAAFAADYQLETITDKLDHPWSVAFLPDGKMLVTEHPGRLRLVDREGDIGEPVPGLPKVLYAGQGGMFDVILHPDFTQNRWVYLSFAEGELTNNHTAIARGRWENETLQDIEVIYRVKTPKATAMHYGGRIVFLSDGTLLLCTGDGFNWREQAQQLSSQLGKTLRMNDDGTPAVGNPFPDDPYIWTYGHRNPQGLLVSKTGTVYLHEHGPRGGDEVNILEPGKNYGWPAITYGMDYSGAYVSPYTEWEGMEQPLHQWTPSIAPSGFALYEADLFPHWHGDLFIGALVDREVRRLDLDGNGKVLKEESLFSEVDARIRDIRVGPDGALYLLTDEEKGRLIRIMPTATVEENS